MRPAGFATSHPPVTIQRREIARPIIHAPFHPIARVEAPNVLTGTNRPIDTLTGQPIDGRR
jgi:hypothetical protein